MVFLDGATVGGVYFIGILKIIEAFRWQKQRYFRAEMAELGKDASHERRLIRLSEVGIHTRMLSETKSQGKFLKNIFSPFPL
jgi:hypothetical protein